MSYIKVGDMYRCKKHPECFFEPGSIVLVTRKKDSNTVVLAKLMFGSVKRTVDPYTVEVNTENDGSVQCYPYELEPFNEPSHMEKES